MFEVVEGLGAGVVGVSAVGTILPEDYTRTLIPLIDDEVARSGKIGFVMVLGPSFDGYSSGAAFEDLRLGTDHLTAFRRLAIVSDNEWLRHGATALLALLPGKVRGFAVSDLEAAKTWAAEQD